MSKKNKITLFLSLFVSLAYGCDSENGASTNDGSIVQAGISGNSSQAGSSGAIGPVAGSSAGYSSGGTTAAGASGSAAAGASGATTGGAGGSAGAGGTTTGGAGGSAGAGGTTTGGAGGSAGDGGVLTGGTGGTAAIVTEFWISPSGNDENPGTKEKPLFTLCNDDTKKGACYKTCPSGTCMSSGATIWVMDGTYKYTATMKIGSTKLGTADHTINVYAEQGANPIFDFSGQSVTSSSRGIQLNGDYWHIKGITVTKAGDSGIFVMGNHNIIERCVVHHNRDAGIVIGVNSSRDGPSATHNLILNCDSYQNFDSETNGENADGFGLKENSGEGNVFRGCRAWDNADDGWDFYAWSSPVTIENSWAIKQASTVYGSSSDGNGFKLGGDGVRAAHKLSDCYAVGNGAHGTSGRGFTNNDNPASMSCTGTCGSWDNKGSDEGVSGISRRSGPSAEKMINAARLSNGDLPGIDSL